MSSLHRARRGLTQLANCCNTKTPGEWLAALIAILIMLMPARVAGAPAQDWRNLHELKTEFDQDLATVLIRLLRHRRSRGWKNVRESLFDSFNESTS